MRLIILAITGLFAFAATASLADGFSCRGEDPVWQLEFDESQARFFFPSPTDMEIPLITLPNNRDWPKAYTLIGERDTAIVLLDQASCGSTQIRVHVLTQRAELPILLTGCCLATE